MSKNIEEERQEIISSYLKMLHKENKDKKPDESSSSYLFMKRFFFNAIVANDLEIVVDLLEKYPSFLKEREERGFNPVVTACIGGNLEMISFFYSKG